MTRGEVVEIDWQRHSYAGPSAGRADRRCFVGCGHAPDRDVLENRVGDQVNEWEQDGIACSMSFLRYSAMKPILQALLLADKIYEDKSGKKIIAGTFNRLLVGSA